MKRILFLGSAYMQMPPIKYAIEQGHYVITCDYNPDSPGHKLAHEHYLISTTDKEKVLNLAKILKIDGIVAYASDPAAPTAAYVGNELGLPSNPYLSVLTLARKDLFRNCLEINGFNVPKSKSFYDKVEAYFYSKTLKMPIFIKPVDSSGSKGVTELNDLDCFDDAFNLAFSFSREKKIVVEEKIVREGYQIAGDGFVVNGELAFRCFANEHFDKNLNGLVPIGESFPAILDKELQDIAHSETQRLMDILKINSGAFNFDFVFTKDKKFYFLELGPRNGGNLIPEVTKYITGTDMISHTVDFAIGLNYKLKMMEPIGFYSSYIIHSLEDGIFKSLKLSDRIKPKIVEQSIWVKPGDNISIFTGSNNTLGTMILRFDNQEEMLDMMDNMEKDIEVELNG